MAEFLGDPIQGYAVRGNERIYPNYIWEPEQFNVKRNTIYFTHLVKGVSDDAKQCIKSDGGFKGNPKKYGEDTDGADLYGRFSWWSVYIDNATAEMIRSEMDFGQEPAPIYEGGSRYGTNLFIEELDELIRLYEDSIQKSSEIRVLSTFEYGREVQHTVVVVPRKNRTFQDHDLVAKRDRDGDYVWEQRHIVTLADDNDGYNWHPFSTVKWDDYASPPKQRKWAHLAFAFYLDPLPNNIMFVPGVNYEAKWEGCNWADIQLETQLQSNEYVAMDSFPLYEMQYRNAYSY